MAQEYDNQKAPSREARGVDKTDGLMVVAIGASAGGLGPLREFFAGFPCDPGIAFLVVTHLDPVHESHLVELLGRSSDMPVHEAKENVRLEGGHIYVIPPGKVLTVKRRRLHLEPRRPRPAISSPIDTILRSVASDFHEQAVAVILSGAGSDGALGIRDIKAAGGLVLAQEPQTAEHGGMPRSAIAAGLVDHVAGVAAIPPLLLDYRRRTQQAETLPPEQADGHLNEVLTVLHARGEHDFRHYKKNTLLRRIARRMAVNHVAEIADYVGFLRDRPDEVKLLAKDLLISVTSFFRDPDAWEALRETVIVDLLRRKLPDGAVRAWVTGCATGEEAYSLAMLLIEEAEVQGHRGQIQLFATDIDAAALEVGRLGIYPGNVGAALTPERLRRFFRKAGDNYQVTKELRDCVVFAPQNLIGDSPFSRLDLISCRNLLIYLESELQKQLFALFHFALVERGVLMLGASESIAQPQQGLFMAVSKKHRIYRRAGAGRSPPGNLPMHATHARGRAAGAPAARPRESGFADLVRQLLLARYAPPSVLINREYRALYFFGKTEDYIMQPTGEPTNDVLAMARQSIRSKLRAAARRALTSGNIASVGGAEIQRGDNTVAVEITATPLRLGEEDLLLLSFKEQVPGVAAVLASTREAADDADVIRQLEDELRRSKDELHMTIEELEVSNEELKVANEEAMSMNEELQSANEELQTSKEELQSLNEELSTINNQLEAKVEELESATNDLHNLLASTNIATLFLDKEFRIKRFTPPVARILRVIPADIGRSIGDITSHCDDPQLVADAERVLDTLVPVEKEVSAANREWYIRRVQPYRTQDHRIDGVVVTYVDITERRRREEEQARLAAIIESSSDAVIGKDLDGVITSWNAAAERVFGFTALEAIGRPMAFLLPPGGRNEAPDIMARLRSGERIETFETVRQRKDGAQIFVAVTASAVRDATGAVIGFSDIERDITERRRAERALRATTEELAEAHRRKDEFLAVLGHELRNPLASISNSMNVLKNSGAAPGEERLQWGLAMIERQTRRLMHLVDDLLDIMRITRGKLELRRERTDLTGVLDEVIQSNRALIEQRNLRLTTTLPKDPVWLDADPTRLAQIFHNLLLNAAWYTEPNGRIDIALTRSDSQISVRVRDTGMGIAADLLPRIFNLFMQGPAAHSRREKGLGIGLTLVRQLVELHGGQVEAFSEGVNRGSEFHVRLPLPLPEGTEDGTGPSY